LKKPIATYVHELDSVINEFNRDGASELAIHYSKFFVSPTRIVAENLINNHGIAAERIFFLNYLIHLDASRTINKLSARDQFLRAFNIPAGKFYVVGMGTASHRKGIDIFVEACGLVGQKDKKVHFVWIGDFEESEVKTSINRLIEKLGVEDSFTMTGRLPHSTANLLPFDLFVLTSREDPYPLVILEAAIVQLPAIGFDQSGGAVEFITGDCGWTIPGFSANTLAEKILELKDNPEQISIKGFNAYNKAIALHTNESLILDQFKTIIDKIKQPNEQ
jgi:glycosyltransferase involved in cell wall biosynthesis